MAGITFIISIPVGEVEKLKSKLSILNGELNTKNSKNSISLKNHNNQSRDILELYEKSQHGSKDTIQSSRSKSLESETAPMGSDSIETEDTKSKSSGENKSTKSRTKSTESAVPKKNRSYESLIDTTPSDETRNLQKSWDGSRINNGIASVKKLPPEKPDPRDEFEFKELSEDSTMEEVVRNTLKRMKIMNAAWVLTTKDTCYQIMFSMESTLQCENFLRTMNEWGIGEREGTSISILPCTFYHKPHLTSTSEKDELNTEEEYKETAWERFMFSMKARLNVATIVEEVKQDAKITFDFVSLVVVAAILAAFGLVEDSTIFLASSMLISPLMGPIIAGIFGTVIEDHKLRKMGVINELIGIFLATFVGFTFGFIICSIDEKYATGSGASAEMLSRCDFRSLIVGVFTALPSGAAVAIAILGENIGSLVGVAISASLLPPAVNAGIFWSFSVIYAVFQDDSSKYNSIVTTTRFSDHQSIELAVLGSISMGLTIINIICIYIMGILFLKIKEVAPINTRNQREFWKHDIKIARDYYKTCQSEDAATLGKKLVDELAKHNDEGSQMMYRASICQQTQNTWSPLSNRNQYTLMEGSKPAMQELESMFHTITPQTSRPITFRRQSLMGKSMSPPLTNRDIASYFPCHDYRRPSHPFDHLTIHHCGSSFPHSSVPLEKIVENIQGSQKVSNDAIQLNIDDPATESLLPGDGVNSRKFIVTPASDPLQKNK